MAERKGEPAFNAKVTDSLRPIVIQHTHQIRTPPPPMPPGFLQRLTPEHAQRLTPDQMHRHTPDQMHRLTPEHAHHLTPDHFLRGLPPDLSRLTPEQLQLLLKQGQGKPHSHLSRSPEQIYLSPAFSQSHTMSHGGPSHVVRGKPEAMFQLASQGKTPPPLLRMTSSPQSTTAAELHKPVPDHQQRQRLVQEYPNQRISPLPLLDMQNIAPPPAHSSPAAQLLSKSPQPIMSLSIPTYHNQALVPPRRPSPLLPDGQFSTSQHRPQDLQTTSAQLGLSQAQALPKLMGLLSGNQGHFLSSGLSDDTSLSQAVNYQSALLQTLGFSTNTSLAPPAAATRVSPVSIPKPHLDLESPYSQSVPFRYKTEEDKPHSSVAQEHRYPSPSLLLETEQMGTRDVLDYSKSGHVEAVLDIKPTLPLDMVEKPVAEVEECKEKTDNVAEKEQESGTCSTNDKSEEWDNIPNPFSQRVNILTNFPTTMTTYRSTYRSHSVAVHRAKAGSITSAAKSLDILRQNLQKVINKEIDVIVQKYVESYFKPAMENIKLNNGENAVSAEHLSGLCRQLLEEAKKMYTTEHRSSTPVGDVSDTVSEAGSNEKKKKKSALSIFSKRRRISDSDSEASQPVGPYKRKKGRPPAHVSGRATPLKTAKTTEPPKREGPKWDPDRLKSDTLFVMGARANKALGLGATRGRLYIKHPETFKYSGDQEDKQWLYENNYMPATGGKAYMLLVEDIKELAETDEYRNSSGLMMHILQGFSVPEVMLEKMRSQMSLMRTDKAKSRSVTPSSDQGKDRSIGSLFHDNELNDALSDVGVDDLDKALPFSNSKDSDKSLLDLKSDIQASPANTELEMLSTDEQEISPLAMTRGFDYSVSPMPGVSPAPSDLDALDDGVPLTAPFDFTD
ncbi:uncharacterized protein LOC135482492 [Lineus longissimus]|uniref:uncharacterized protein LOC135482492 n=1 Tax=Lineus longissimus TaxID=88925 RepID=UPI002B4E5210